MSMRPLVFDCQGERLLGMLHPGASGIGMVVVVGGPQYRVGSHRHFVQLACAVSAAGHPVLRFDVRGMGDSTGELRDFQHIGADIAAAIDALCHAQPQVEQVVLWGLCDGASAAMMYLHERRDARVAGLCLVNPWVRSAASLARAHVRHYYLRRLAQADFWRKLLRGGVAIGAIGEFWSKLRQARARPAEGAAAGRGAPQAFQDRMRLGWQAFGGPSLLMLSGKDYTADEFVEYTRDRADWQALLERPAVQRLHLPEADHTLSQPEQAQALEAALRRWLDTMVATRLRRRAEARADAASA